MLFVTLAAHLTCRWRPPTCRQAGVTSQPPAASWQPAMQGAALHQAHRGYCACHRLPDCSTYLHVQSDLKVQRVTPISASYKISAIQSMCDCFQGAVSRAQCRRSQPQPLSRQPCCSAAAAAAAASSATCGNAPQPAARPGSRCCVSTRPKAKAVIHAVRSPGGDPGRCSAGRDASCNATGYRGGACRRNQHRHRRASSWRLCGAAAVGHSCRCSAAPGGGGSRRRGGG